MKKCTEPDFTKLPKRTTLSTGMILQCIIVNSFKWLIKKVRNIIISQSKE